MSPSTVSLSAAIVAALATFTAAEDMCSLQWRQATVTECVPKTGTAVTRGANCPTPMAGPAARPGAPINIEVDMPSCDSCGCDGCVHSNVYTATFDAFCTSGIAPQEYIVTELYTGMSAAPTVTNAPSVPFGFTADVQICTSCGPTPITATLTHPATGCPYIHGMSEPTGAPEGAPAYEVYTTNAPAAPAASSPASGSGSAPAPANKPGSGSSPAPAGSSGSSPAAGSSGSSPAAGSSGSSPESGSGSAPTAINKAGSGSPTAAGSSSSSPAAGSSGSPPASGGSSSATESTPGMNGASPASTTGYAETSGVGPAFVAVTMGAVLGCLITFLAVAL